MTVTKTTPRRNPVMRDVARLAGVSHQTVSRVLNDSPLVSDELRRRVREAIDQLGYRPHSAARALASRQTMNLGVIALGGVEQLSPTVALYGIAEVARRAGYATSLVALEDTDRAAFNEALEHLTRDAVDGIIVIAPLASAVNVIDDVATEVPVVMFQQGYDNGTTRVAIDEELGARLATRHLLELGHETVWHVAGPADWLGAEARLRGWRSELAAAGRVAHEPYAADWTPAAGYRAGQDIAQREEITAVFAANDHLALGVLKALRDAGVDVPGRVSVVGFDNRTEAPYFSPALTTVDLDFAEVGRRCVERLLRLIHGEHLQPTEPIQPALVVRDSTSPPHR